MTFDQADMLFQQDLTNSLRRALTGFALSEDEEGERTWEGRIIRLTLIVVDIYGEDVARTLLDQARAGADEQLDSFMGSLYMALSDAAKEANG